MVPEHVNSICNLYKSILSNAVESMLRDNVKDVTYINMNKDTISIKHIGHIPIIIHNQGKLIPELVFSDFNISRNSFNKSGYDQCIKIVNVFSRIFTVVVHDHFNNLKYTQTWFDNMLYKSNPIIEPYNGFVSTVEVIHTLDFERFGMKEYTDEIILSYKDIAKDEAAKHNVVIQFNNEVSC